MTTRARGGGRKPKPTALKLIQGNPGKRPLPENEPHPPVRLPSPPSHLSNVAKREWRRTGQILLEMGLISELDKAAFASYCQAWARWVEAEQALASYGIVLKSPNGFPTQSPYLAIANRSMEQIRSLLGEFGMSPASRTRVTRTPVQEHDPLTEFLGGSR